MRTLAWMLVGCLAVAGCARFVPPSEAERALSAQALASRQIDGEPLPQYLLKRSAFIVSGGVRVDEVECDERTVGIQFERHPKQSLWLGQAAAVDRRGYFLTAAHCVETPPFYLVFWDGERAHVTTPRVVAREGRNSGDYAILKVETPLREVFTWADDEHLRPGLALAAVGTGPISIFHKTTAHSRMVVLGGHLGAPLQLGPALRIYCDVPLRPGDSGAAMTTLDGGLLGINGGVHVRGSGGQVGFVNRPPAGWVAREIARDQRGEPVTQGPDFPMLKDPQKANLILTLQ